MARLKLSPSGLRSPLDLSVVPAPADVAPADEAAPRAARLTSAPTVAPEPASAVAPAPAATAPLDAPAPVSEAATDPAPAPAAAEPTPAATDAAPEATAATEPAPAPGTTDVATAGHSDASDVPAWAQGLAHAALAPDRLLGRPKQTALILDRELSSRADALVAATGPRVTFAALVTAILHFHLPADGEAAARAIGGYRRRKLETLDRPWEERNARLPEPLRAELDDVVAGATGRVASVRRSTLVNALLDAHLPADADGAARLVVRMEMVRGGAFLDLVA
ncbi:hypothetical protein [Patulibacter americanus]|uniref:hypothetical protein n=1 Tax=Patulibacter americanus TaxID=588672 RepID=UPI0003B6A54A|nr:hypothetical protein [Patulibacter americanus]